jgi:enterochelin esterase family protein
MACSFGVLLGGFGGVAMAEPENHSSLRDLLVQVQTAPADNRQTLAEEFIRTTNFGGFPCVEESSVCFVYKGEVNNSIYVAGDFNDWDPSRDAMVNVEGTNLFTTFYHFPMDARLDYKFVKDGQWILDPLNPRTVVGGFGPNSELQMPHYQPAPEIEYYPDIRHGTVEKLDIGRAIGTRNVHVYLPPGYSKSNRYPVLYVQDGGEYLRFAKINNVVDYMLSKDEIEPLIVVLIDPVNRNDEYAMSDKYMNLVVDTIVPHIDATYQTVSSPSARCIMGASLGGLISVYIALQNPDCFASCAAQSTPFRYGGDGGVLSVLETHETQPVDLYIDCGTFETRLTGRSILAESREARRLFISGGFPLSYHEYPEGHSWGNWRAHLDNILKRFFRKS